MGLEAEVFTRIPAMGGAGKVIAEVRHTAAPEVVLGEVQSTPVHLSRYGPKSTEVYRYQDREFTLRQWKVYEKKLHHDFKELVLSQAKRNLALLQMAKD